VPRPSLAYAQDDKINFWLRSLEAARERWTVRGFFAALRMTPQNQMTRTIKNHTSFASRVISC